MPPRGPERAKDDFPDGSRWVEIQQLALRGSCSSLHSEAYNALGASDGVCEMACLRATANMAQDGPQHVPGGPKTTPRWLQCGRAASQGDHQRDKLLACRSLQSA
eukprot:8274939-Pyramimonas_sp.AAC.1